MDKLEESIREKVEGSHALLPGISLAASSTHGEFYYTHVAGPLSMSPNSRSLKDDDVFWIASCTKLLTTICMLQCIEEGLFYLDEDIARVLPEWKDPDLLVGFDETTGKPILRKAKNKITIRHLLTHTAGMQSIIPRYQNGVNAPPRTAETSVNECSLWPLIYEPGEGWQYSASIDWAGKMRQNKIERVTQQSLSTYMAINIFCPLHMTSTTFRQHEIIDRLVPTTRRPEYPNINASRLAPGTSFWSDSHIDDFGGGGLYSVVSDYMKVLGSVLKNDELLLSSDSVNEMFKPQLSTQSHQALNDIFRVCRYNPPLYAALTGNHVFFKNENDPKAHVESNWGLGGLLLMEDVEGGRRKGSLSWSGLPNLYWWIDPTTGVCGMYASQLMPAGDLESARMNSEFEKAVYEELRRRFVKS